MNQLNWLIKVNEYQKVYLISGLKFLGNDNSVSTFVMKFDFIAQFIIGP